MSQYQVRCSLEYYDEYGAFTSTVAIDVSVQWTPGFETLGIAILDANTGTGYGYWYTGAPLVHRSVLLWDILIMY